MKRFLGLMAMASLAPSLALADGAPAAGDVLVTWRDGLTVTRADYEAAIRQIPERDREVFQMNPRRIGEFLNGLLLTRSLAAEARQSGLDRDPVVQREMALAAERLLATRRVQELEKSLKIPDLLPAAEERYRVNPAAFQVPEQVHVAHVLVETKNRSDEEARARAEMVRTKALAGADFAQLAKEYSEDPSAASNQGDLGPIPRGRMVKPFEDAAFALAKPGDLSPVTKSQFGYHVIKLIGRIVPRQLPFAEVKDQILADLTQKFIESQRNAHLQAITNDKSIIMNTAAIDSLRKEPPKVRPADATEGGAAGK